MDILNKTMLNQVRENNTFKRLWQTSLVIQWMKIHPLRKGTQVWFLVWKDSTCRRTTTPLYHNYWAFAPQLLKPAHPRSYTLQETTAWKAHKPQWWVAPLATVRESPCTVTKTQCSQQLKKKKSRMKGLMSSPYASCWWNYAETTKWMLLLEAGWKLVEYAEYTFKW